MKKRKAARILNDLSMVFFLISSTVVAFLPIADREKHPAIAVLAGGIFWAGLLWGDFPLQPQLSEDKKSEKLSKLLLGGAYRCTCTRIHQRGSDDRYRIHPGIAGDHTRNLRVPHTGSHHVSLYVDNHGILLRTLRPERKGIQVFT